MGIFPRSVSTVEVPEKHLFTVIGIFTFGGLGKVIDGGLVQREPMQIISSPSAPVPKKIIKIKIKKHQYLKK